MASRGTDKDLITASREEQIRLSKQNVAKKKQDTNEPTKAKKANQVYGRSIWSWLMVVGYSIFFAAGLSLFWGLCLWVFYQTLDNYTPKLQTTSGFIGANPGLGFRPMRKVWIRFFPTFF